MKRYEFFFKFLLKNSWFTMLFWYEVLNILNIKEKKWKNATYVLGESTCFSSLTTSLSQKVDHNIVDWALAKESEDLGSRIGSITLNRRTKGKISLRLFPQLQNSSINTLQPTSKEVIAMKCINARYNCSGICTNVNTSRAHSLNFISKLVSS